jgi:hypothetical protein
MTLVVPGRVRYRGMQPAKVHALPRKPRNPRGAPGDQRRQSRLLSISVTAMPDFLFSPNRQVLSNSALSKRRLDS